jgi:hypothetical protein
MKTAVRYSFGCLLLCWYLLLAFVNTVVLGQPVSDMLARDDD